MKVSRGGFYAWIKRDVCARALYDAELKERIQTIFDDSRQTYGTIRVHAILKRHGINIARKRVYRLMKELGVQGISTKGKRRAKVLTPECDVAYDLVRRGFFADAPNVLWFADITYVKTHQGWLYLAVVFDIFSRLIVGWSMDNTMTASLVDNALRMGLARRRPQAGLIHHSDRGSQYRSLLLSKTMQHRGIRPSMGSIKSPWDNAVTESLMSTIKRECVHRYTFETHEQAKLEIFDYIECFYNQHRIHSALGNLSPMEFEDIMSEREKSQELVTVST